MSEPEFKTLRALVGAEVVKDAIKRVGEIPLTFDELNELNRVREEELRREKMRRLLDAANLPVRHVKNGIRLDRSGEWGKVYDRCEKLIATGFIIALVGGRGSGKTQLGVQLIMDNCYTLRSSRFCTTTQFFIDLKATFKPDSKDTEGTVIERYRKPKLLVMDEIGRKGETTWHDNLLFELINARYNDMKDTVLICNLTPAALTESIGPALVDRINESGGVIECNWKRFRT